MFRIHFPTKLARPKSRSRKRNDEESADDVEVAPDAASASAGGGTDFKPFTKKSAEKFDNSSVKVARECGYLRRRKSNVEDESVLPGKYEPFPSKLYGRPLEEIDNFIYEEVSKYPVLYI